MLELKKLPSSEQSFNPREGPEYVNKNDLLFRQFTVIYRALSCPGSLGRFHQYIFAVSQRISDTLVL